MHLGRTFGSTKKHTSVIDVGSTFKTLLDHCLCLLGRVSRIFTLAKNCTICLNKAALRFYLIISTPVFYKIIYCNSIVQHFSINHCEFFCRPGKVIRINLTKKTYLFS